jgi:extracellular factor (EF) 3-hydroxypalmitic acid methyl ester biosynthesis protein
MLSPGTALRDTCEREEAVQAIHEANRRLREAVGIDPRRREQKMHANVCAVHELCGAIQIAEQALDDEELAILLKPSYDLHAKSPFVRRLQIWPRGYPGDFETIEALLDGRPSIQEDDDAYWIDWYALNCAIACQHRNKVTFQAERILEGLPPSPAILSVGCGGAADLAVLRGRTEDASICLVDIDGDALRLAAARVAWAATARIVQGDAIRFVRQERERYDRIVFGGLFDYLTDRQVAFLLRHAFDRLLNEGGRLVFTNLRETPFRLWIENLAAWRIIYRSTDDLLRLLAEAGIDRKLCSIRLDQTGIAHLCEISKDAAP